MKIQFFSPQYEHPHRNPAFSLEIALSVRATSSSPLEAHKIFVVAQLQRSPLEAHKKTVKSQ